MHGLGGSSGIITPFHFYEYELLTPACDQIDLAERRFEAAGKDAVALELEPESSKGFGAVAATITAEFI